MHFIIKLFYLIPIAWSIAGLAAAQTNPYNALAVSFGGRHITLLDEQATPVLYQGAGPAVALQHERAASRHLWRFALDGGKLAFQPVDPALRFYNAQPTGFFAGFDVSRLTSVAEKEKIEIMLGPGLQQEILVDFEGIGNWPYVFVQGGVFANGTLAYRPGNRHRFEAGLALPLVSWLTDMPHQQIPRVEGRAPDVASLFKTGTRLTTWLSYQRVDAKFGYTYHLRDSWSFTAWYDWAWFHDAKPRDLWAWQGNMLIGVRYRY